MGSMIDRARRYGGYGLVGSVTLFNIVISRLRENSSRFSVSFFNIDNSTSFEYSPLFTRAPFCASV